MRATYRPLHSYSGTTCGSGAMRTRASRSLERGMTLLLVVLALGLVPSCAFAQVGVTVDPWGAPSTSTFDPKKPPDDMDPDHDADCGPGVFYKSTFKYKKGSADGKVVLTLIEVNVTVTGNSRIRLPTDADDKIKGHEDGHDRLFEYEYEKKAKKKFEDALRDILKMRFVGEGATREEQISSAKAKIQEEINKRMKRAQEAVFQQMSVVGNKFDNLTDHGKGKKTTAEGEKEAKEEFDPAPPAGDEEGKADDKKVKKSKKVSRVSYDNGNLEFHFARRPGSDPAAGPGDPVDLRGRFVLEPMVVIGSSQNGTIHLSDTTFRIVDAETGDQLMKGYVLEAAYFHKTSRRDAAGVIQGYLDVPPDDAGGINQHVRSQFLSGMGKARDAGDLTRLWIYTDAPLLDKSGHPVSEESVSATLTVGVDERRAVRSPAHR